MNATISMDALYTFLKSLSLDSDNERWLGEKLIKDAEESEYISKEEILAGIDAGLKDMKAGRTRPIEELLKELEYEVQN